MLLALWALLFAPHRVEATRSARKWDELRVAHVVPTKISTLPLNTQESSDVGGLFKSFGFGKTWLRLEGIDVEDILNSQGFSFDSLEYPHEWAATLAPGRSVMLRVGSRCKCRLSGVAVYAKSDSSAWLRLHFEDCEECESTAKRAAVVVGLAPSAAANSNVYNWMCAIYPYGACSPSGEESTRAATTAKATTTEDTPSTTNVPTTTTVVTTTTINSECSYMTVALHHEFIGHGKCKGKPSPEKHALMERDCYEECLVPYMEQISHYEGMAKLNQHVSHINHRHDVCKGYSYNAAIKKCIVYSGDEIEDFKQEEAWQCFGRIKVHDNGYAYHWNDNLPECSTPVPLPQTTETTTSTQTSTKTSTTTLTTTTRTVTTTSTIYSENFHIMSAFGAKIESDARVFGYPSDVHFQREGLEATMMQLQSVCFDDVDYYMLGGTLPVIEAEWNSLMHLLTNFGAAEAWSDKGSTCPTSATIDRIPVDVDFSDRPGRTALPHSLRAVCTVVPIIAVSLVGLILMGKFKTVLYPDGIPSSGDMDIIDYAKYIGIAIGAAAGTFALVYCLQMGVCWFSGRLAAKKLDAGDAGGFMLVAPLLSKAALAVAGTAAGAAAVIWLWPATERENDPSQPPRESLLFSYNPVNGDIRPVSA